MIFRCFGWRIGLYIHELNTFNRKGKVKRKALFIQLRSSTNTLYTWRFP